jgi:hypothetical protein
MEKQGTILKDKEKAMSLKHRLLFLLIFFHSVFAYSQPVILWQKSLGGSESDVAYSIKQTSDSGYIVAGYTESNDSDVTVYHGNRDYWIVKLNNTGSIQWQKSFGGTDIDAPHEIHQTMDGGFIVAGYSISNDIDVTGNHGQEDYWIVKLNSSGILQWEKSLGGSNEDRAYSVYQTNDGGYIVAGSVKSIDGDITFHHGGIAVQNDFWIVRLDSVGTILWQKSLGGGSMDIAYSIQQTTDGGFIVAGSTNSADGDVTGFHGTTTYADVWVVKLNNTGVIQWQKALGGTRNDYAYYIRQTTDGGYIVAGNSSSNDGDVTLHWGSFVDSDVWIVKLDSIGAITWQKTFGGTDTDISNIVIQTSDGGYIVAGYTSSSDGDLTGLHGINFDYDYWIIKMDASGNMQWQKLVGGTSNDVARSIVQTYDQSYIVAGYSSSVNGHVTASNGNGDFWVVKLSSLTETSEIPKENLNFNVYPNPFSYETSVSFPVSISLKVTAEIRNLTGQLIKSLNTDEINTGANRIRWDASDNEGNIVSDGIYILDIYSENYFESKKIVVLRN